MFKAIIACSNTFASLHYTCRTIMLPCKCVHRCIDGRIRYIQNIHSTSTSEICFNNNNNVCKTQKTLLSVYSIYLPLAGTLSVHSNLKVPELCILYTILCGNEIAGIIEVYIKKIKKLICVVTQ